MAYGKSQKQDLTMGRDGKKGALLRLLAKMHTQQNLLFSSVSCAEGSHKKNLISSIVMPNVRAFRIKAVHSKSKSSDSSKLLDEFMSSSPPISFFLLVKEYGGVPLDHPVKHP
jgi:hypothetical protein